MSREILQLFQSISCQSREEIEYDLAQRIKVINEENEFNEIDLNDLKQRLEKLQDELNRPMNISIEQPSMGEISLQLPFEKGNHHVNDFDL